MKKRVYYIVTPNGPGMPSQWTRAGVGVMHDDGVEEFTLDILPARAGQKIVGRNWHDREDTDDQT